MTAKAPQMAKATGLIMVEGPPAAAEPAAPAPDATDQGLSSGMPKSILPGDLAQDAEQDVNEWYYDLTGVYELAKENYDFREHYVAQRRPLGPSGVEHTMNVSIHFCKIGDKEEMGWWFAEFPGGRHRFLHNSSMSEHPPCTGWVAINGSDLTKDFRVTSSTDHRSIEVTAGNPEICGEGTRVVGEYAEAANRKKVP